MIEKKFISDIISLDDIKEWTVERPVIIQASTGCGKTYFIRNKLCDYARSHNEKILLLSHRVKCVDQNKIYIKQAGNDDVIDCQTYQSIEYAILHGKPVNLDKYKYIVVDEFHYFLTDAVFNHNTDVSLDAIMRCNSVKIMMSATCDDIVNYLNMYYKYEYIKYTTLCDYSYIKMLYFYDSYDYIQSICEYVKTHKDEKALIFMNKVDTAVDLYLAYKDMCTFCCSEGRPEHKYSDENAINDMLVNKKFDSKVLISTSVLSTGIDLYDKQLKHIVITFNDVDEIIQAIGRKRLVDDDDIITLHIQQKFPYELKRFAKQHKDAVSVADDYMSMSESEFKLKYPRMYDNTGIIYDKLIVDDGKSKAINMVAYTKHKRMYEIYEQMCAYGKNGFCKYVSEMLSIPYQRTQLKYGLKEYLENRVEVQLYSKEEKQALAYAIGAKARNKVSERISMMNTCLESEYGLDYVVESKKCNIRTSEYYNKRYWVVKRKFE